MISFLTCWSACIDEFLSKPIETRVEMASSDGATAAASGGAEAGKPPWNRGGSERSRRKEVLNGYNQKRKNNFTDFTSQIITGADLLIVCKYSLVLRLTGIVTENGRQSQPGVMNLSYAPELPLIGACAGVAEKRAGFYSNMDLDSRLPDSVFSSAILSLGVPKSGNPPRIVTGSFPGQFLLMGRQFLGGCLFDGGSWWGQILSLLEGSSFEASRRKLTGKSTEYLERTRLNKDREADSVQHSVQLRAKRRISVCPLLLNWIKSTMHLNSLVKELMPRHKSNV
eukprot:Gb_00549 [translate_table: standard]